MNRQEAIEHLKGVHSLCMYDHFLTSDEGDKMLDAIDALKPPTPDPDTGLVPCGCGGKAELFRAIKPQDGTSFVQCTNCTVCTGVFVDEEKTRSEWNRAMGCREEGEE